MIGFFVAVTVVAAAMILLLQAHHLWHVPSEIWLSFWLCLDFWDLCLPCFSNLHFHFLFLSCKHTCHQLEQLNLHDFPWHCESTTNHCNDFFFFLGLGCDSLVLIRQITIYLSSSGQRANKATSSIIKLKNSQEIYC